MPYEGGRRTVVPWPAIPSDAPWPGPDEVGTRDRMTQATRHFTVDHTYNTAGEYRVQFRLKQKNKVVGFGSADVKVRPGIRDGGGLSS